MKVAVMQPYFFPYLGYFQLIAAVDHFVFFDDVAFIKKGFIHRNNILLSGQAHAFTVPVAKVSQNREINDHEYTGEFSSLLKKLRAAYSRAPYYEDVYSLVEEVCLEENLNVAIKNALSIVRVFDYLGVPLSTSFSSQIHNEHGLRAGEKIIHICKHLGAKTYINPVGGRALYDKELFTRHGLDLRFLVPALEPYRQFGNDFVAGLSIIDALMFCSKEEVARLISKGALES